MGKIKFIFVIVLGFIIYKGYVAFTEFEIGVEDRVAGIEEKADFEREGEVIGLMMYLGNPPELKEHLFTDSRAKCLELKQIAEESSYAYYECARVNAVLKGKKIVYINPQKKIHALVIPKGKYIDLDDFASNASEKDILGLIKGINKVAKKLQISSDTGKGYRALANISEYGGQEVPHLHFHLFGGEKVGKMVE